MKKFISLICLLLSFIFISCEMPIKEYQGKEIIKLTYTTIDFFGGNTITYEFDFIENKSYKSKNNIFDDAYLVEDLATFTEEQEEIFMNKCYTYGLFSIEDLYENKNVEDGGGWTLTITYDDDSKKESKGKNKSPKNVFDKCAYAFYDLCNEGVLRYIDTQKSN